MVPEGESLESLLVVLGELVESVADGLIVRERSLLDARVRRIGSERIQRKRHGNRRREARTNLAHQLDAFEASLTWLGQRVLK